MSWIWHFFFTTTVNGQQISRSSHKAPSLHLLLKSACPDIALSLASSFSSFVVETFRKIVLVLFNLWILTREILSHPLSSAQFVIYFFAWNSFLRWYRNFLIRLWLMKKKVWKFWCKNFGNIFIIYISYATFAYYRISRWVC